MAAKKSGRSTKKPRDIPKEPSPNSRTNVQLIIQNHIIKFMGYRFPEFCVVRAACRVSVRASSSATGDARVASYQAAIDSVAARHYTDWPFMVEVLNKWLEMNQDFVRDPVGYLASDSSPAPASATGKDCCTAISMIQDAPSQTTTSSTPTSGHLLTQSPPTATENVTSPLFCAGGATECVTDSSPTALATGTGPSHLVDPPPSSNVRCDVSMLIQKFWPLPWTGVLRHFPPFGGLGAGTLISRNPFSLFPSRVATSKPPTHQISHRPETRWFKFSFLASSYKGWWDALKKCFALGSG